jgi:hypothetical protein
MAQQPLTILEESLVRAALRQAWQDSQPGVTGGHEEGGFILQDANGELSVLRWPRGKSGSIVLPTYSNGKVGECDIVATFHTHPNTGADYLQEPSDTDRRAVRDDAALKGAFYEGEYVVSTALVYLITPDGQVTEVGSATAVLA